MQGGGVSFPSPLLPPEVFPSLPFQNSQTSHKVKEALKKKNNGKEDGLDNILSGVWKRPGKKGNSWFTKFNEIMIYTEVSDELRKSTSILFYKIKRDIHNYKNYKGLSS